jgi:hypothetical protein
MKTKALLCALVLTAPALPLAAQQLFWDAPSFFSPRPMDDIGIYVTRANQTFEDATGLSAIWRQSGNLNLGVRAGVADLSDAGGTVLVGAEFYGPLNSLLPASQLEIAWGLGAGAVFGSNYTTFSVPLGLSIGLRLGSSGFQILPYAHPRLSLDIQAYDQNGTETTKTDGSVALDLGADISIGERLILRVGGSLLDREAFGAGLALRWPRPISVR